VDACHELAAAEALRAACARRALRVTVEYEALSARARDFRRARLASDVRCPGDDICSEPDVRVTLLEALALLDAVRGQLAARFLDLRVGDRVQLPDGGAGRVLATARVAFEDGSTAVTDAFTVEHRLPRAGDTLGGRRCAKLVEIRVDDGHFYDAHRLRRFAHDALDPLCYVNCILHERKGCLDMRLTPWHSCVLVQRKPLSEAPFLSWRERTLLHFCRGELQFSHVDALVTSEHCFGPDGSQRLSQDLRELQYVYPLADRQLLGARVQALLPSVGHSLRQGPQARALSQTGQPPSVPYFDRGSFAGGRYQKGCLQHVEAISNVVSRSRFPVVDCGASAPVALYAVAFLGDVDGMTYEDAGATSCHFAQEQGRAFAVLRHVSASCASQVRARQDGDPLHLDADGRARGFVLKDTLLATLRNGKPLVAPLDAWVEAWGHNERGAPSALLLEEHAWQSGMKVVWMLQKSVLTSSSHPIWAPLPISFLRDEYSCVARNAASSHLAGAALRLLLARDLHLDDPVSCQRLPGIAALFKEQCNLKDITAARELTPLLSATDRHRGVSSATGRFVGELVLTLQELNNPGLKTAPMVRTAFAGHGCARIGFRSARGQGVEEVERIITQATRDERFDVSLAAGDRLPTTHEVYGDLMAAADYPIFHRSRRPVLGADSASSDSESTSESSEPRCPKRSRHGESDMSEEA
jgi:hypothetical protein